MGRKYFVAALLAAAGIAASPALADVKSGVEAWTRGDFAAAVKEWQGPAIRGDADAQFNLGQAYKLGRGVSQDLTRAEALFGQAAAQGHLQAADNYGLLLFQRGQRSQAMPFVTAAAERGDPRAQYLLGIAHFNGDNVPKDWVRAYALVSLARQAGLDQARPAQAQMDGFIPLDQRQQAVALAGELAAKAEAARARQLAAVDLGSTVPTASIPPAQPAASSPGDAPTIAAVESAVAAAARAAGGETPRTAGADFARPATTSIATPPAPRPTPAVVPAAAPRPAPVATPPSSTPTGPWRIQLGAFGVSANADAAWNRVKGRPELAGHPRINARSGSVIRLQAGGFASEAAAKSACNRLSAAGSTCIVVRN
jgi:cell division septation protein DedD